MGKDPSHARNLIALGHKWLVTIAASRPGESTVPVASGLHDLILLIINSYSAVRNLIPPQLAL